METQHVYFLMKIKEEFSRKQRVNEHYSLRAFARDLNMHPSTLSQVLNGHRPLPLKDSLNVVNKLKLGPKDRTLFLESLYRRKTSLDKISLLPSEESFMLDESYYKVIAEWEHYAVLELFELKNFKRSIKDVSKRLLINMNRAEVVIENLLICNLLSKDEEGKLVRSHSKVRSTEDVKNQALVESHKETLTIALNKLEDVEVELRDYSSMTIAVDLEKLTEAKTIIREFRQKMEALLRDGNRTDLYQLAIQLFPLTNLKNEQNQGELL